MPHGFNGVKQPIPWFAPTSPSPYWGHVGSRRSIAIGFPQHVLTAKSAALGFNADVSLDASGNIGGGAQKLADNSGATLGAILNLSAAQIASAPAFKKNNLYD